MPETTKNGNGLTLRLGLTAAVSVVSAILGIGITWGVSRADAIEDRRRIQAIEEQTVRKEQLEDIKRRLDSIEKKLDKLQEYELSHRR